MTAGVDNHWHQLAQFPHLVGKSLRWCITDVTDGIIHLFILQGGWRGKKEVGEGDPKAAGTSCCEGPADVAIHNLTVGKKGTWGLTMKVAIAFKNHTQLSWGEASGNTTFTNTTESFNSTLNTKQQNLENCY